MNVVEVPNVGDWICMTLACSNGHTNVYVWQVVGRPVTLECPDCGDTYEPGWEDSTGVDFDIVEN